MRCLFRPFWLMILLAVLVQHITSRFCFIKKDAGTRDLNNRSATVFFASQCHLCSSFFSCITAATYCILKHLLLPHRGNLFLLTYLMFPVNVLIGVLLGVWRMIITALFNIVHMGRMDISLLNRNVEAFDPGEPDVLQTATIELSGNGIW